KVGGLKPFQRRSVASDLNSTHDLVGCCREYLDFHIVNPFKGVHKAAVEDHPVAVQLHVVGESHNQRRFSGHRTVVELQLLRVKQLDTQPADESVSITRTGKHTIAVIKERAALRGTMRKHRLVDT